MQHKKRKETLKNVLAMFEKAMQPAVDDDDMHAVNVAIIKLKVFHTLYPAASGKAGSADTGTSSKWSAVQCCGAGCVRVLLLLGQLKHGNNHDDLPEDDDDDDGADDVTNRMKGSLHFSIILTFLLCLCNAMPGVIKITQLCSKK